MEGSAALEKEADRRGVFAWLKKKGFSDRRGTRGKDGGISNRREKGKLSPAFSGFSSVQRKKGHFLALGK